MDQDYKIAVCETRLTHLNPLFDALCETLEARGFRYVRLPSHDALFARPELLAQVEVIVGFGAIPVDAHVLHTSPALRGVVSCVSGTDGIDLHAATAAGVIVAHAPTPENARSMAEATMLLLLHLAYDLDGARDDLRLGRPRPHPVTARMLHGKSVGLVGWGHISKVLASLLEPWGVRLRVHSRRGTPPDLPAHAQAVALETLMAESDYVCVLAGAEANAPPLIDREKLAWMKPDAHLINVSRGANVDESALADALASGSIQGAALDVFAVEPLPADSPLRKLHNVVLTPHHVGHTREGDNSLVPALIENVLALLDGEVPPRVRNPQVVAAWRERWGGRPVAPSQKH